MHISENIRLIRVSKGLSATDVAKQLGIPRTSYNNYEDNTEPTVTVIKSLADIFKVHYTQIIDGITVDVSKINLITTEPRKSLSLEEISEALQVLAGAVSKIVNKNKAKPSEEKDSSLSEFRADQKHKGIQSKKGKSGRDEGES